MKKKLLTAILLVAASTFWTNALYAAEYQSGNGTPLKVTRIYVEANRPAYPQYSHMIFFELADMSWSPATCDNRLIALPDTEKMSAATLLSAHIAKKPVIVFIDDTLKSGPYCQAIIIYTE